MREKIKNSLGYVFEVAGYVFLVAVMAFMLGAYNPSRAATYTWVQTDWSTGATGNIATHTSNQTGWAQFTSGADVKSSVAGEISLYATSTTRTTDTDFSGATNSNTAVSGSGNSASVVLNAPTTGDIPNNTFSTGGLASWTAAFFAYDCGNGRATLTIVCGGGCYQGSQGNGSITSSNFYLPENSSQLSMYITYSGQWPGQAPLVQVKRTSDGAVLCNLSGTTCSGLSSYAGTQVYIYAYGRATDNCGPYLYLDDFYIQNTSSQNLSIILTNITSGTYTSAVIDIGRTSNFTTLSYTKTQPTNTALTVDIRAGNVATPDGTWTAWQTGIANGGSISALNGNRYVQYRGNFTRSGGTVNTATLDDITINHPTTSANLISSPYDSTDANNALSKIQWTESLPSGTDVKFQLRTSADNSTWTGWMGTDGTSGTYFTDPTGGEAMPSAFASGGNDRYFEYQATLTGTGTNVPTLSDVTVTYTVNAAPNFDATFGSSGASASQITDSADANWGKVKIMYSVRDTDTTSGSATPNYVTPSFQYNIGGGLQTITSGYLSANALSNKSVSTSGYTTYTAYWDAKTQIPNNYLATAQIKVTVDDNEGANNTANVTVSSVTLDTTAPALTAATANSTTDLIALNVTDNTNIQYRFSNSSDLSADGSNGTSGAWQTASAATYNNSFAWVFTGAPSYETVYYEIRDLYNNITVGSIVIPSTPLNFEIKDVSNINTGVYKMFSNWSVYTATTSGAFANYKVYRSTNGTSYSLLTTLSDVNLNYYLDTTVASTTTYYYKVTTTDTGGDVSNYSAALSDLPNGQGGSDNTPPTISAVTVAATQATWVRITWTTDEVANSTIEYSTVAANNYALTQSNTAYVTSHDVTLSGLTPGAAYVFRVKSTDAFGNLASATSAGYTFTTASGPSISAVATEAVADTTASIIWNTSTDADSYVLYSTSAATLSGGGGTAVGSATRVGGTAAPYQHRVSLTGLSSRTTYYYSVKSTDASSNLVTDTNAGSYYNFATTYDTIPPVISGIAVPVKSASSLVVTWQTNELADSQISYGTASGAYSNSTTLDATLSINHAVSLAGLSADTKYYYVVKSRDAAGNLTTSAEQNETTASPNQIISVTTVVGGGGGGSAMTDTTPPLISNIKVSDVGPFEATVSFQTNEDTSGFAMYGVTSDLGKVSGDEKFRLEHKIKLVGLRLGTDYKFRVAAADKGGNVATSDEGTFTTKFATEAVEGLQKLENAAGFQEQLETLIESYLPSLAPPFIGKVDVTNVTENSAKVSFKTNTPAYGILQYASERDYHEKADNPYATALAQTEKKLREHVFELTGLASGTEYHIQAQAYVLPGVVGKSKDTIFYTDSAKISPEIARLGNTMVELNWRTDVPTSSFVEYRDVKTRAVGQVGNPTLVRAHNLLIGNLVPNNSYDIRVFGEDAKGQRIDGTPLRIRTKQDTIPPEVSAISINNALLPGRADKLQTVIAWKTNEPANSLVYFDEGLGQDEPKNLVGQYGEYMTEHIVIVTAMKPATVYRIKIVSFDESGNKSESPMKTILTPRSSESVLDIIIRNFEESFGFLRGVQ